MAKSKMKFVLFGNTYQKSICTHVQTIKNFLADRGAELTVEKEFLQNLIIQEQDFHSLKVQEDDNFTANFAISLGGDGTFLHTAQHIGNKQIPIIGINTGHLGFLTDTSANQIEEELQIIFNKEYSLDNRTVIELVSSTIYEHTFALNDIAILKRDTASMISISININGEYLATYQADGLIVSTPTGSTAYSLAVGGPVVAPNSSTLTLTAVAPHSLNVRPIVITDDSIIDLSITSRTGNFLIGIDGHSRKCDTNTKITIKKAPYNIIVVRNHKHHFFSTLREKLFLGARGNEH